MAFSRLAAGALAASLLAAPALRADPPAVVLPAKLPLSGLAPWRPVAAHAGGGVGVGPPGGAADRPPGGAVGRPGPPAVSCGSAAGGAAGIPASGISRRWQRRGPSAGNIAGRPDSYSQW